MQRNKLSHRSNVFYLTGALCLILAACGGTEDPGFPQDSVSQQDNPSRQSDPSPQGNASQQSGPSQQGNASQQSDPSPQDNASRQSGPSQQDYASPQDTAFLPPGNTAQTQESSSTSRQADNAEGGPQVPVDAGSSPEITLVMVGDILLHTPVAESGLREDGSYDFSAVFAHTREEISSADLALVNQEVILGGTELGISGYPAFNAPYELGDALADTGFDVVLHATNHALDKGAKGITNCLTFWENSHPDISVLGIHGNAEDQNEIYIYEQNGIKIAILNYTYGTNGIPLPQGMDHAVDLMDDLDRIAEELRQAEKLADFTIVCPHWGTEYRLTPDDGQETLAQFFWENGADLVLGTHPHVIEPVAWVTAEGIRTCDLIEQETGQGVSLTGTDVPDGMLVYFSLGNFVNWTSGTGEGVANRMVGGMAKVTLGLDDDGTVSIKEYGVEPLVCHVEGGRDGVTVYPFSDYTERLAEKNAIRSQDGNFSLQYCRNLLEQVW